MAKEDDKSCEARIDSELESRLEDFRKALESEEDFIDWLNGYVLAYEDDPEYRGKRLELSWGGPQDYFVFKENGDIVYYFLDWFDEAHRELYGDDLELMDRVRDRLDM